MITYPTIVSAEGVGGDGLVHCVLTNGDTQWYGDFTQSGYRIEVLKREFVARGVPQEDVEAFVELVISDYVEDEFLSE